MSELTIPEIKQVIVESKKYQSGDDIKTADFLKLLDKKEFKPGRLDQAKFQLTQDGKLDRIKDGCYRKAANAGKWLRMRWV